MAELSRTKAGFGAGVALLTVILSASIVRNLAWQQSALSVAHSYEVIERLGEISFDARDAEDAARAFTSSPDQRDLARSMEDLVHAKERGREVETMVADDAARQKTAQAVRLLLDQQSDAMSRGARSGNRDEVSAALAQLDRAGFDSRIRTAILELEAQEHETIRERTAFQNQMTGVSRSLLILAALFAVCMVAAAAWTMSTDLKKHARAKHALAAKEEQYRQVVDLAGDIICRTDEEGRFIFINQAALAMLHLGEDEVIGRSYLKLIRQDKRRHVERFYLRQFGRKQKTTYHEFPVVDGHGVERWFGQNVQLVLDGNRITGFQAIARDITERRKTEIELQKSRSFIERIAATTPGILYVYDLVEQRNIFTNPEAFVVLGYKPEDFLHLDTMAQGLFHPDDQAVIRAHHEALRHSADADVRRIEYRVRHADGHWVWLAARETPFERGPDGLVRQTVGIAQDVTAGKAAQDKLAWQANFDALTGLANRHHFWTRLQGALRRASIEHSDTSLCLFDVDHFKEINDRFGHAAGDEVLEAIGNIVRGELRSSDIAGRLGGDEFCFALPGTDENESARVAERIRERLSTLAFGMTSGSTFSVTATFGVARSESDTDAKELMEAADRALYRAKSAGRNRVMVDA